jgi:hypothetical protein
MITYTKREYIFVFRGCFGHVKKNKCFALHPKPIQKTPLATQRRSTDLDRLLVDRIFDYWV